MSPRAGNATKSEKLRWEWPSPQARSNCRANHFWFSWDILMRRMNMSKKRAFAITKLILLAVMVLATIHIQPVSAQQSAGDLPKELADALAGKYKGTKITAFGAFADADEVKFNENVKDFEAKTEIDIQYESNKQIEATISTHVDAGNPPDIVDFPQPGLMGTIAKTGKLIDLRTFMSEDYLKGQYLQSWLD